MKDSWGNGDDRRDRGRVDRGVSRPRRSRSPPPRRPESAREPKARHRSPISSRVVLEHDHPRERERSQDRRRRTTRSPPRDLREVRERNRGRELLDTRGSDKTKRSSRHSPSSGKRRKSRSVSPSRDYHKKSRRGSSRSPPRLSGSTSSRHEKKRHTLSPPPPRRHSLERKHTDNRGENRYKHSRESGYSSRRGRSPSPEQGRHRSSYQARPRHRPDSKPDRSSPRSPGRSQKPRERSRSKDRSRKKEYSPRRGRKSDFEPYEPESRSRPQSPRESRDSKAHRGSSSQRPRGERAPRDDHRSSKPRGRSRSTDRRSPFAASGGNAEAEPEKMAGRGYYGGAQNYHPAQQMQAAFPLKPQYNQGPPDPRQYSQSPQHHMTPNSYNSSPQAHSPYNSGRGNWGGSAPQQYSPQHQYPPNQQQGFSPTGGPQGHYYGNQSQSPSYQTGPEPLNQQYPPHNNYRGNRGGFRGNSHPRGRGEYRGRGGYFQNLQWNAAGRGRGHSGNVTPQRTSPQQQYPNTQDAPSQQPVRGDDDGEDLFRPSTKDLQVEDKDDNKKKDDEEMMPPPGRPPVAETQSQQNSSKFSFAFKASSKVPVAAPKPEISQKLNAAPSRPTMQTSPERRAPPRPSPTQTFPPRRHDFRAPPTPTTRKVKRIMKRLKERPQLQEEFKASDSVYYRKPGNESVVGSGTYGKVFKAIHVYTKSLVALKKIRMEGERDGFPVTAVREIKLLQSLKHQNIVNLQEVMVEKNDCFMVFEYLSHDLTGLLNHPSFKLEPSHKKHLARQLFEGLDYLHRRGVLHRDIKAANILVSSDGQLKLADFGLARFYAKRRQLDYTNRVITIWYRSPELLLGETQYGPEVDIWSAACVLVEIFTRHAIFPGDGGEISQLDKIYAILGTPNKVDWPGLVDMAWFELLRPTVRRTNVFAEKYKDKVTPAAFDLLEAMFQYDPTKRPSASDVLEHPYFTVEEPQPRQAIELAKLDGDWHEFESKALRKENERKDKEARRQAQKEAYQKADKDKKRPPDTDAGDHKAKRIHTEDVKSPGGGELTTEA